MYFVFSIMLGIEYIIVNKINISFSFKVFSLFGVVIFRVMNIM